MARRLKYYRSDINLSALQAELAGGDDPLLSTVIEAEEVEDNEDEELAASWGYAACSQDAD